VTSSWFFLSTLNYDARSTTHQISIHCVLSVLKQQFATVCAKWVQNLLSSRLLSKNLKIKIYRTIILSVVLYGYETWSLTLREERKLRVFENKVLSRIFGPRNDEVTGEWRWLHNEELNDLYSTPNIVRVIKWRRMRWAGHVAEMNSYPIGWSRMESRMKNWRSLHYYTENILHFLYY